jgi:tetratricopeptide (TPR) repeat protein
VSGYWSEGRHWLEAVLAQRAGVTPALRARALLGMAVLANFSKDGWDAIQAQLVEALALFRATGDRSGIAATLTLQGGFARNFGDHPQATQALDDALSIQRALGDQHGIAETLNRQAEIARDQGKSARTEMLLEESLGLCRNLGFGVGAALVLNGLGEVACAQGAYARAMQRYWEAMAMAQNAGGNYYGLSFMLHNLGWLALIVRDDGQVLARLREQVAYLRETAPQSVFLPLLLPILGVLVQEQGEASAASGLLREGLLLAQQLGRSDAAVASLEAAAWVLAGQKQMLQAARCLGAVEAFHTANGMPWPQPQRAASAYTVAAARAQLGEASFAAARAAGQALTLEQALAEALNSGSDGMKEQ